jgi:hypothetical protein
MKMEQITIGQSDIQDCTTHISINCIFYLGLKCYTNGVSLRVRFCCLPHKQQFCSYVLSDDRANFVYSVKYLNFSRLVQMCIFLDKVIRKVRSVETVSYDFH